MSTSAIIPDDIEGLPPGAVLKPISGLPQGAVVRPIGQQAAATANPYQQAADRTGFLPNTSMSAGPAKPQPEGPGWFDRFMAAVGIPTSQGQTTTAMQNMLTPKPEPGATGLVKAEESMPILGSDFTARSQLAQQNHPIAALVPFVGPAIANYHKATAGADKLDPATIAGSGLNVAGQIAGMNSLLAPKPLALPEAPIPTKPPAASVLPKHVEALTGLIEDKGGTVDPHETASAALPVLRETAVRMGVDPSKLTGRAAGQTTLKVANQAIADIQNEFNQIRQPYNSVLVEQKPIADAYRNAITPELNANEPQVAASLEKEAKKFDQPAPLEQVNQFRVRLNNQLNAFEQRGTTAQIMSDIETKAAKKAADAARNVEYDTVGRLSGLDSEYVRGLKQREGSLIETKNSLEKEYNRTSGQQGEAVSEGFREKLTNTFPSKHGATKSIVKNLVGPKPVDVLNNRLQKMFGDMGSANPLPEYQQIQPPTAPAETGGPSGPIPSGESDIDLATRRAPGEAPAPAPASTYSRPNKVVTPESIANRVNEAKGVKPPVQPAPVVENGQITQAHVDAENAFYVQARTELGANANPIDVLRRAQALKLEAAKTNAAPPKTPVPPTFRPTLTQKVQAQPLPKLQRVVAPEGAEVAGGTKQQQANSVMLLLKQGQISPAEADSRIQKLVGSRGTRTLKMPQAPE